MLQNKTWFCSIGYVRGLSGKFVDTSCFHCILYIFQKRFTYYSSVTQEWIKYKTGTVLRHIYTQCLLLWQCKVEVTGARQNFLNGKYQILFLSFNSIISERENVVKLNTDVRKTLIVTCGKFERRHDSDIAEMIFCCEIQWMKSLKKYWRQSFRQSSVFSMNFRRGQENSRIDQKVPGFIFLSSQYFKWHKRFTESKVSTKDNDNERVDRPTLTDERALMLREVIDIDRCLTVCDTAKILRGPSCSVFPKIRSIFGEAAKSFKKNTNLLKRWHLNSTSRRQK